MLTCQSIKASEGETEDREERKDGVREGVMEGGRERERWREGGREGGPLPLKPLYYKLAFLTSILAISNISDGMIRGQYMTINTVLRCVVLEDIILCDGQCGVGA